MLLLIPTVISGHAREIVELGLGLVFLGAAAMVLIAGIWWFRFRVINVAALLSSGLAAYLFRRLSYTSHGGMIAKGLCVLALVFGAVAAWRILFPKRHPRPFKRGRRRSKRMGPTLAPPPPPSEN